MRFFISFRMTAFHYFLKVGISILFLTTTLQLFSDTILVGGIMAESETWTSENTYVVFQDLIVPDGIILSIDNGVTVKIDYGRGIIIDKGVLKVSGIQTDSVKLIPNHINSSQTWKWKGLVIKNASIENENFIHFTRISAAETGIKLENSMNVTIENSSMVNCQNLGVQFINSSLCFLVNSNIENNYDGIEILADYQGVSSNNTIFNCIVKNHNHNIYVFVESDGAYQNNLIANNIIGSGNNGIWIDDNEASVISDNRIEHNVILNNGAEVGYGLFLAHNSTLVANNIFWQNNIAIFSEQKGNNLILNNSFYQNNWAVAIVAGWEGNDHANNTFSLNSSVLLAIQQTKDVVFHNNNIMNTNGLENIVVNSTDFYSYIPYNYWGTIDTSQINKLIYDSLDNPELGEFEYNPYSVSIDTSNPVSPPFHVIKQIIDNRVHFSWNSNKELDLMGYRVYYGNYSNYSFLENYDLGLDTTFIFPIDILINSSVAVTAYDSVVGANSQLTGHESPFAFAVIYPYSGSDTIICEDVNELKIENSNIPMEYNSLSWSTSGDGYFSNPNNLMPTYFPGILDIENGTVSLSLNVEFEDKTLVDSFILSIIKNPIAYAGNDTIIFADAEVNLIEATAHNYDGVKWLTGGDGSFNSDTLVNPVYYPGNDDIESGVVFLKMVAYSNCSIASDSVKVVIGSFYSVEGKIWASQKYVSPGIVIAFMENDEGVRAMQIESAESDGTFKFDKLMAGNYYMYAVPDTSNIDNTIPGYYANNRRWQSAYVLPVNTYVYDVDIYLSSVDFDLPIGDGSISGHMEIPIASGAKSMFNSDIYCMSWFDTGYSNFCNGGLSNNTVLLFNHNRDKLLDFTLTDELGNFYFNKLPYGDYVVDAEKAGLLTIASPVITLYPEHNNETGVVVEISQENLKISVDNDSPNDFNPTVYPNPASTEINIPYLNPYLLVSQLEVYDLFGNRVLSYNIPVEKVSSTIKLNINDLTSGLYFGRIINSSQTTHFRFVKR